MSTKTSPRESCRPGCEPGVEVRLRASGRDHPTAGGRGVVGAGFPARGHGPVVVRERPVGYEAGPPRAPHPVLDRELPGSGGSIRSEPAAQRSREVGLDGDRGHDPDLHDARGHDERVDDEPALLSGLPVLDELPELGVLLEQLTRVDRLLAVAVATIRRLDETGAAEAVTGVGLARWLSVVARRTSADVRMLRTAARVTGRLPSLAAGFDQARLSWAQVRAVTLQVERLPGHLDDRIDAAISDVLQSAPVAGADPDSVCHAVRVALAGLEEPRVAADEREAERAEFLAMQPRLDGTGGRLWGEAGPETFALLDAALNPPDHRGHLHHDGDHDGDGDGGGGAAVSRIEREGRRRIRRLARLLHHHTRRHHDDGRPQDDAAASAGGCGCGQPGRPLLVLRAELAALLDRRQTPATLLTQLTGGRLQVSAATARRLVDQRGADLRTVVLDDTGAVVGVGRRQRLAPGWITEALLGLHDVCSAPGCQAPARACHTDHATPWWPTDDRPAGRTDLDNLAPLCAAHNHTKEPSGWQAQQAADGTRTWTHPRSGLTTRTLPATWRPPP